MAHLSTSDRVGSELSKLVQDAEEFARQRHEALTTVHLLAAVARSATPIGDALQQRELTATRILEIANGISEPKSSHPNRIMTKAVDLARRMGVSGPNAAHLVMAVLSESNSVGRRAFERLEVDIARLRSQAWNIGIGWSSRVSTPVRSARSLGSTDKAPDEEPRTAPTSRRPPTGVTIPLFPPARDGSGSLKRRAPGKAQALPVVPQRSESGVAGEIPPSAPETAERQTEHGRRSSKGGELEGIPRAVASTRASSPDTSAVTKRQRRSEERFVLDSKRFPILTQVGTNLTLEAARHRVDEVVGRDAEIERMLDVLAKRQGNSPCLVGPSGVGKTSIVRGLALRMASERAAASLDDRILIEIPVSELVAGTGVRGALAQRVSALRQEVKQADGRVVVFFDEIQLLFAGDTADETAGELKLALARGEFPCVGATTLEGFRRSIEADPALSRRFVAIDVEEPSPEDAFLILDAASKKLALHHRVRYSEQALALGIGWSVRYLPQRSLPEKALAIADLAGARARRRGQSVVEPEQIAEIIASMAEVPLERLLETDAERMLGLERLVAERVVGHTSQIQRICNVLRRNAAGLGADRPIGTFLLLGPTGVGKTETAKALARALFHSEAAMTRLDMAEYAESHAIARLIGSPPGYVGHEAGGQLTEAVRKRPYQVLLLDEIEKAHDEVLQAFLGVFDEGRLTDSHGRTVDFKNTIIMMTSNLGAEHTQAKPKRRVGFGDLPQIGPPDLEAAVIGSARARLSPELYNRIDECLVFSALRRDEVQEIARRLILRLTSSLGARGISFKVADSTLDYLVEQGGFDACLGARPMKRAIARLIETPLADRLLSGEIQAGSRVEIGVAEGAIAFRVTRAPAAASGQRGSAPSELRGLMV